MPTTIDVPEVNINKTPSQAEPAALNTQQKISNIHLLFIALGAFILGILLTIILMKRNTSSQEHGLKHWHKQVLVTAQNRDFRGLRDALLNWGAEKFNLAKLNNFNELKNLLKDKSFADELDKLNALLYTENNVSWNAKDFCVLFEQIAKKTKTAKKKEKLLPDLYK